MVIPGQFPRRPTSQRSDSSSPTSPLSSQQRQRLKTLVDRYQVLILMKPQVAATLLDFLERFLRHY